MLAKAGKRWLKKATVVQDVTWSKGYPDSAVYGATGTSRVTTAVYA